MKFGLFDGVCSIMFYQKYHIEKEDIKTKYGSISIENITFDPIELQNVLPQIVFEDENLKYMFAESELNNFLKKNICRRFIPKDAPQELTYEYIESCINSNKNFYSFLAEGILGLVYRDLYNYKLSKGLIDILDTVSDTHTGVDACMYDVENEVIILGEAKFYESLNSGIDKIIEDFTKKNIKNKIDSLLTAVENNIYSNKIVIKNIEKQNYESYSLEEFLNQKIIFAGFVLHSATNVENYGEVTFYDNFNITSEMLKDNIKKTLQINEINADYSIVIVHLPIKDKKQLIIKIIEMAKEQINQLRNRNYE